MAIALDLLRQAYARCGCGWTDQEWNAAAEQVDLNAGRLLYATGIPRQQLVQWLNEQGRDRRFNGVNLRRSQAREQALHVVTLQLIPYLNTDTLGTTERAFDGGGHGVRAGLDLALAIAVAFPEFVPPGRALVFAAQKYRSRPCSPRIRVPVVACNSPWSQQDGITVGMWSIETRASFAMSARIVE